ncbi:EBP domain-containing protein [Crucibulum laeve]|uniref:EBP domain-containing protein n=1 Tax=Crucibulum laeve TaxID=68775 RepID=A0A5C3MKU3_9AGAR|nr:EBP domain-containing protein [Crucibulum laeve]
MTTTDHPYYPVTLDLPTYQPNTLSYVTLIGGWLVALSFVTLSTYAWLSTNKSLTSGDKWTGVWFMICGCIHVFFEGHFVRHHSTLASKTDFLSQAWKEYSKSDSRYLTSDPFILVIESITSVLWGPLCFYVVWSITRGYTSRYVLTALVSLGHIYGDALYYGTTVMEGAPASRPEYLYFWIYFVGTNSLWMIAPTILLIHSIRKINSDITQLKDIGTTQKKI